jgi:glycosyltransferase involved in cell wall biosynthesis
MTWDNFRRPIEANGKVYGTKELEFGRVESLAQRSPARFELAVGGASPPIDRWRSLGWSVIDSHGVSQTMKQYRQYIQSSRGEFSVAKNVYVATRSGWSSCRSVCYLASGRPVVVQDTGFSEVIPSGEGLLTFSNIEQAVEAVRTVESNYQQHQEMARRIANEFFDSDVVLKRILNDVGLG